MISWWRTELGEASLTHVGAAMAARQFSDGTFSLGCAAAIGQLLKAPHVVMTPSGSAALLMAMMALEIGPGDEVIVPDITWIATAHAASLLGARIRLVDTLPDTPLLDVGKVEAALTSATKAIVAVHLNGRSVDMPALMALARARRIAVVEDAAQAIYSYRNGGFLGTHGDIGCISLGMTKLVSAGQGGAVVTRDATLYDRMRRIKYHGVETDAAGREHYRLQGFNFKMSDLCAALAHQQILDIDSRRNHVVAVYDAYRAGLAGLTDIEILSVDVQSGEIPLWTEVATPRREALVAFLAERGIETRRIHEPLHRAPHLLGPDQDGRAFPLATRLAAEGLILPCGPAQPLKAVEQTIEAIRAFLSEGTGSA